jgi:hypothetical protein
MAYHYYNGELAPEDAHYYQPLIQTCQDLLAEKLGGQSIDYEIESGDYDYGSIEFYFKYSGDPSGDKLAVVNGTEDDEGMVDPTTTEVWWDDQLPETR